MRDSPSEAASSPGASGASSRRPVSAARYVDVYMEAIRWDNAARLYEQYSREA